LPSHLQLDSVRDNVVRSVHVEAGWHGNKEGETAWLQSLSSQFGFPHIILGGCDFTDPNCKETLLNHMKYETFRGIRAILSHHDSEEVLNFVDDGKLSETQEWRKGVAELHNLGLVLDVWCYSHQIPQVVQLADLFPSLTIVLNHFGTPVGINQPQVFEQWKKNLSDLSKRQNVYVKLSGFGMPVVGFKFNCRDPSSEEIAGVISGVVSFVLDAFTASRCLFASNFPVDRACFSYHNYIEALKIIFDQNEISLEHQKQIFLTNFQFNWT